MAELGLNVPGMSPRKSLEGLSPPIHYKNFSLIDRFIVNRVNHYGMCVVCIDGKRGIGKTTLSTQVSARREELYHHNAPLRGLYVDMDWCLYPRNSEERSLERSAYDYYRWGTLASWIHTIVEALSKKDRAIVTLPDAYMRSIGGTIESTKGQRWTLRREIPYPNPLIVISGSFVHDPRVIEPFLQLTEPIRILMESDDAAQQQWILGRGRSSTYRSDDEEILLTHHDNLSWEEYAVRQNIVGNAHIIARVEHGRISFRNNQAAQ